MTPEEKKSRKLLDLLSEINFSKDYYQLYEKTKSYETTYIAPKDIAIALHSAGLQVDHNKKEGFFSYRENEDQLKNGVEELGLNIAYKNSQLELVLVTKIKGIHLGGPFTRIATAIEKLHNPSFEYNPRSPKLHFSSGKDLSELAEFCSNLYTKAKERILNTPW